jgi:hypothetical protein
MYTVTLGSLFTPWQHITLLCTSDSFESQHPQALHLQQKRIHILESHPNNPDPASRPRSYIRQTNRTTSAQDKALHLHTANKVYSNLESKPYITKGLFHPGQETDDSQPVQALPVPISMETLVKASNYASLLSHLLTSILNTRSLSGGNFSPLSAWRIGGEKVTFISLSASKSRKRLMSEYFE